MVVRQSNAQQGFPVHLFRSANLADRFFKAHLDAETLSVPNDLDESVDFGVTGVRTMRFGGGLKRCRFMFRG